jgi:phosphoglycolate phosphatase-like HAD superfamily hydrolase
MRSPGASIDAVFFDFDGTLTDADACAAPFLEAFRARIARRAALAKSAFAEAWSRLADDVDRHPERHGWVVDGQVVAPACADPYLRASRVAKLLLEHVLPEAEREAAVDEDFAESYRHVRTVFREEAAEIVDAVLASGRVACIVSNTRRAWIEARLAGLSLRSGELRVAGEAAKWAIAPSASDPERLARVPEQLTLDGLGRPMLLRRGRYLDAIVTMEAALGVRIDRALVCGDVFELDLGLPHALGAHVHLIARTTTPAYELRALAGMPRAATSGDLQALRERLQLR